MRRTQDTDTNHTQLKMFNCCWHSRFLFPRPGFMDKAVLASWIKPKSQGAASHPHVIQSKLFPLPFLSALILGRSPP